MGAQNFVLNGIAMALALGAGYLAYLAAGGKATGVAAGVVVCLASDMLMFVMSFAGPGRPRNDSD